MTSKPFLTKLTLHNFKSFGDETVVFFNPLILVGRNGSGKTNFVKALSFLSECMDRPLRSVIETQGRLGNVSNILIDPYVTFRADFTLPENASSGYYTFTMQMAEDQDFVVTHEQCQIIDLDGQSAWFVREAGQFSCSVPGIQLSPDAQSLALPVLGVVDAFTATTKALGAMRVYQIAPGRVNNPNGSSSSRLLERDGSNAAGVIHALMGKDSESPARIGQLLSAVAPLISEVYPIEIFNSNRYSLGFFQNGQTKPHTFFASWEMSDGTLRALGLILALMQDPLPSLIALEEPEAVIHPGALGVIADLIENAAQRTQIVITTHSPELLDTKWIGPENLRVVEWEDGYSHISELGLASVNSLQRHLAGAGELLRANALDAAPRRASSIVEQSDRVAA